MRSLLPLSSLLQKNSLFRCESSHVPASCETEFLPLLCSASLLREQLAFSSPGVVIQRAFSNGKASLSQAVSCLLCPLVLAASSQFAVPWIAQMQLFVGCAVNWIAEINLSFCVCMCIYEYTNSFFFKGTTWITSVI